MKINRYKLRDNIKKSDLQKYNVRSGGSWIISDAHKFIDRIFTIGSKRDSCELSLNIAFKKNIYDWNDFDNILVLDERFCQPYTPFYQFLDGEIDSFPFLDKVIQKYNEIMNSIDLFEKIE